MIPSPGSEPSKIIKNIAHLDAKKIRFQINQIELPIGIKGVFGRIQHPGAALAVPITDDGKIVLLRQYRFAVGQRILEFPAGTLEEGEDPLTTMKRELAEEAGFEAAKWDSLGPMLPCPGYSDEIIHLFLARSLKPLNERPPGDEDEDLEVLIMSQEELEKAFIDKAQSLDGKSIAGWFRAKEFLKT